MFQNSPSEAGEDNTEKTARPGPTYSEPSQDTHAQQTSVWGPELNKNVSKEASGSHCSQGSEGTTGGSTLLNKLGDKLFARCSGSSSKLSSNRVKKGFKQGKVRLQVQTE